MGVEAPPEEKKPASIGPQEKPSQSAASSGLCLMAPPVE